MAELTRDQWTPAAFEIAKHLKALEKIASDLGINGLSVGISTKPDGCSWAFHLKRNEQNETVKAFEVQTHKNRIIFEEDNIVYKTYECT